MPIHQQTSPAHSIISSTPLPALLVLEYWPTSAVAFTTSHRRRQSQAAHTKHHPDWTAWVPSCEVLHRVTFLEQFATLPVASVRTTYHCARLWCVVCIALHCAV